MLPYFPPALIAGLLAADADLELRAGGAALLDSHRDELADAVLVDGLERVGDQKLLNGPPVNGL